jgi:hypothetical protein
MLPTKLLKVVFDAEIAHFEVPAFRGAISNKVGHGHVLFHNHTPDGGLRHAYPLIQYKRLGKKPAIICIGEGVNEIHHYFSQSNWDINISGREVSMRIDELNLNQYKIELTDTPKTYEIRNWIGLNQKSHQEYKELEGLAEKTQFMERKLVGNILSMAKGIGWTVPEQIVCKIIDLEGPKFSKIKDIQFLTFDVKFKANISLPNHIGLGGKVSLGFGMVRETKN